MDGITHTQIRNKNKYEDILQETNKKSRDRSKVKDGKGNKVVPRRYHLSDEDLISLKKEYKKTGVFPNPYRRNGVYHNLIQALINLGVNRSHPFVSVKNEMKRIMNEKTNKKGENIWEKFLKKKSAGKSDLSRWDANTRIEKTASILQRLGGFHPYGYKLKQLNACVDLLPSSDPLLPNKCNIRLNTSFYSPEEVMPVKPDNSRKKKDD